jgi:hypothetical protein
VSYLSLFYSSGQLMMRNRPEKRRHSLEMLPLELSQPRRKQRPLL